MRCGVVWCAGVGERGTGGRGDVGMKGGGGKGRGREGKGEAWIDREGCVDVGMDLDKYILAMRTLYEEKELW